MKQRQDHSLGNGVFYVREDCRGVRARVMILMVDLIVLIAMWIALAFAYAVTDTEIDDRYYIMCSLILWVYMAVLKPSSPRTVGYWLTGSEIVTLRGRRPSILRMTFRLLLWLFGPINLIYDLAWAGVHDDRQSLRDRFAGTLLIRRGAKPIGAGEIHLERYFIAGFAILDPRVMHRRRYGPMKAPKMLSVIEARLDIPHCC